MEERVSELLNHCTMLYSKTVIIQYENLYNYKIGEGGSGSAYEQNM